ncbi:MAG: hypothetical protein R3244_06720, partial [Thermoanaerobaculia bacterium]|nr:hypothetical protein [Thermoanaerobaculia bacterium]
MITRATSLITVEEIEPCLAFWTEALGFEVVAEVPHESAIGFALLTNGAVELMYQTRASIDADLGATGAPGDLGAELATSTATLFVEVADLDAVIAALGDRAEVLVPRRQTSYGMDELFVRAPCGTVVGFAARIDDGD